MKDPNYKGGQKVLITNTDTHTIFELLKARFEKGEQYKIMRSVEPYLWVRHRARTETEILLRQVGSDVSIHLLYYYFSGKPWNYSDQYINLVRYLYFELNREVPVDVLKQLNFRVFVRGERSIVTVFLMILLISAVVVAGALLIKGSIIGVVLFLFPVAVIIYYLLDFRRRNLNKDLLRFNLDRLDFTSCVR
jgi:hypothetical protein